MTGFFILVFVPGSPGSYGPGELGCLPVCKAFPCGQAELPGCFMGKAPLALAGPESGSCVYGPASATGFSSAGVGNRCEGQDDEESERAWLRFPKAKFRPDDYGIIARIRTVPKSGSRKDFEEASPYIADAWRCVRVQVSQQKPGRLVVRGLTT